MPNRQKRKTPAVKPDFEKKKRKVGKGKQPAENVTPLNFKSRSIFVPAQLGESSPQEPTTYRRHGLQTLMVHLKHYKASVRHDALVGLRDLFQANPDLLLPNLAKLVEQGMSAMVDDDSRVRHALCVLLNLVLTNISSKQLMPFSSLFIAHLSCGLTHIDDQIQLDSVKYLDVFLSQPALIVPYAYDLLSLLMKLISRQRNSSAVQSSNPLLTTLGKAKPRFLSSGTLLASNPDSKLADHMSRLKIFTFLSKFAEAIFESDEKIERFRKSGKSDQSCGSQSPLVDTVGKRVYLPTQGGKLIETCSTLADFSTSIPHVPVLKASGIFIPRNPLFEKDPSSSINPQQSPSKKRSREIAQSLLSLLLESWIECSSSSQYRSGKQLSKKTTTFSLMEIILRLIVQVLKLIPLRERDVLSLSESCKEASVLQTTSLKFLDEFRAHFLSCFPFSPLPSFSDQDSNMTYLDFLVCLNTVKLIDASGANIESKTITDLKNVCNYIVSLSANDLRAPSVSTTQSFQNCVSIFVEFFPALLRMSSCVKPGSCLHVVPLGVVKAMISRTRSIYSACHPMSKNKQLFLQCFSKLLRSELDSGQLDMKSVVMTELLLPWLHTLPDLFVQLGGADSETSSLIVRSMLDAAVHGNREFVVDLEKMVNTVLTSSNILNELPAPTQRRVVEMLWYLPHLSLFKGESLSVIVQTVLSGVLVQTVAVYLIQTLYHKFTRQYTEQFLAPFLSFMLSVIVGHSRDSLLKQVNHSQLARLVEPAVTVVESDKLVGVEYQANVVKAVCECLRTISCSTQILHILEPALLKIATSSLLLPLDTVVSLLSMGHSLIPITHPTITKSLALFFSRLCLSLLVTMEINSDLVSQFPKDAVAKYLKLTNEILCCSETLLIVFLRDIPNQFSLEQKLGTMSTKAAIINVIIRLLSSADVSRALMECRGAVQMNITKLLDMLSHDEMRNEVRHLEMQLEVTLKKYIHTYT